MSDILAFKASHSIRSVLSARGIAVPAVQRRQWMAKCPLHDDRTPSFAVNEAKELWYCHTCRVGGDVLDLVAHLEGKSRSAILAEFRKGNTPALSVQASPPPEPIDEEALYRNAALEVQRQFSTLQPATAAHGYLIKKGVGVHGDLRVGQDGELWVTATDLDGNIWSVQRIQPDGQKWNWPGGKMKGCVFRIGNPDQEIGPIILCEGYATGATLRETLNWPVLCCFSAGNLAAVALQARERWPDKVFVFAADDDRNTTKQGKPFNPGLEAAKAAAKAVRGIVLAPGPWPASNRTGTDWNDWFEATQDRSAISSIFNRAVFGGYTIGTALEAMAWPFDNSDELIAPRLVCKGQLSVIIAPAGAGKSRLAMQLAYALSAGHDQFLGWNVRNGQEPIRTLILQKENSLFRLRMEWQRLQAWLAADDPRFWTQICSRVHLLIPRQMEDLNLDLDDQKVFARLSQIIRLVKPHLVILDSLYNFTFRDLRLGSEMHQAILKCCRLVWHDDPSRYFLMLHHALPGSLPGQRGSGIDKANYARDSKVLHQIARAVINVVPVQDEEEGNPTGQLLVSCAKLSDAEPFSDFVIQLNPATLIYERADHLPPSEIRNRLQNKEQPVMKPEDVREFCSPNGSTGKELVKAIRSETVLSQAQAYRLIQCAIKKGILRKSGESQKALIFPG
jgi:phage/plasmid primase-like uncharacterized protein